MNIILESARDKRTLEWLISQVGLAAVEKASEQLAGHRKPYVSNIAKILSLEVPESILQTPKEEARSRLSVLRQALGADRT